MTAPRHVRRFDTRPQDASLRRHWHGKVQPMEEPRASWHERLCRWRKK